MRRSEIVIAGIIIVSFIVSIFLYPEMPEEIATHWNAQGNVNGYMSKFWGVFFLPFLFIGIAIIFFLIPRIDPLKRNIESFINYFDSFLILFFLFMFAIHIQIILWNLGIKINPNIILTIGLGILFFYVGILCEHTKRNWFIGIRTPWTLSSDTVWKKTHRIGGKLFKITGAVIALGIFFQTYAIFFIIIPSILSTVYVFIYSYVEYRKEMKSKTKDN